MYPGTIVVYEDRSQVQEIQISEVTNRPLFLNLFTSDKGPEDWRVVSGKEFFDLYGSSIDFSRHGQPLLQAAMTINWGGRLFCKRVVAENSVLANTSIYASVYNKRIQKRDSLNRLLYYDANGNPTITNTGKPIMTSGADLLFRTISFDKDVNNNDIRNISQVKAKFDAYIATLNNPNTGDTVAASFPYQCTGTPSLATTDITLTDATFIAKVGAGKYGYYNFKYSSTNTTWYLNGAAVTLADYGIVIASAKIATLVDTETIRIEYYSNTSTTPASDTVTKYIPSLTITSASLTVAAFKTGLGIASTENIPCGDYDFIYGAYLPTSVKSEANWYLDGKVVNPANYGVVIPSGTTPTYGDTIRVRANSVPKHFGIISIADIGRGVSNKRISITPNTYLSKNNSFVLYDFKVMESGNTLETMHFSLDPETLYNNANMSLKEVLKRSSIQVVTNNNEEEIKSYINTVTKYANIDSSSKATTDLLFGRTAAGKEIYNIHVFNIADLTTTGYTIPFYITTALIEASVNLAYTLGQPLLSGSNGAFGDSPMYAIDNDYFTDENGNIVTDESGNPLVQEGSQTGTTVSELYIKRFVDAILPKSDLNYDWSDPLDVYDLDRFPIDICSDANYPEEVKRAIETLATYREDFLYCRDIGLGKTSITAILNSEAVVSGASSKFISTYLNSYDILDPYSNKQITVSVGYSLPRLWINQWQRGVSHPLAGQRFNAIIPEAIDGTVNFVPRVCPESATDPYYNQKETLVDARINYAGYYNNILTLETVYTGNPEYSQFSFSNNIVAIQQVVKAVRKKCPAIRYSPMDGPDFDSYKKEVTSVLSQYTNNFMSLNLEYLGDSTWEASKTFYAAIKVKFKDFVQTEYFRVIAVQ